MAQLLKILTYPHPILSLKAKPITHITEEIKTLAKNMIFTMEKSNGIGLAANQVGVLQQIAVINIEDEADTERKNKSSLVLINPQIMWYSKETIEYEEGCLSFPELRVLIKRPYKVTVKYTNIEGKEETIEGEELLSICLQHEIDHLNGILFINRVSSLKKTMLLNKYKRLQTSNKK